MTVYDKVAERLERRIICTIKLLLIGAGTEQVPRTATRIEYQMGRRWLLEQGIDTPKDFLDRRGTLMREADH